MLACELPALPRKKQYARNRRFSTPEKRTRKMKTKLQQNARLFVPPSCYPFVCQFCPKWTTKKLHNSGCFFFYQKQVRDSQRVLVRTLAYAPFKLEPLSSQKPHYSFRHLEKKPCCCFGVGDMFGRSFSYCLVRKQPIMQL